MLRLIFVYASSTGLQRALSFLAVPILSSALPLEALGRYTLALTIAQFMTPIVTWNMTVALTREAIEHPNATIDALRFTLRNVVAISIGGTVLAALISPGGAVPFGLALGGAEAAFASSIAVLQGRESAREIFAVSMVKSCITLLLIVAVRLLNGSAETLLIAQTINASCCAFVVAIIAFRQLRDAAAREEGHEPVTRRMLLAYSAATLPHTAGLWLSVSADRIMLGLIVGKAAVGSYAIAYTFALGVMLVLSGVIAALPPRIARYPEIWRRPEHVSRMIWFVMLFATAAIVSAMAAMWLNLHVLHLVPKAPKNALLLIALIGSGLYASLFYVLFAAYMYLNRETGALARTGLLLGPLNLAVVAGFVWLGGMVGAAVGVMCVYGAFGFAYYRTAVRLEPQLSGPGRTCVVSMACLAIGTSAIALLLQ